MRSVAEIGHLERHRVTTLGVSAVSNRSVPCSLLSLMARLASSAHDPLVADISPRITSFGKCGGAIRGGMEQASERRASSDVGFDFPTEYDE